MRQRFCTARGLLTRAQHLVAEGKTTEALELFERAGTVPKPPAGLYVHWALALSESGRLDEAVQAMQQALVLRPTNPVLPMFLGQIYFDHAEYSLAQTWCERALEIDAQQWRSTAFLALIAIARGDIPQGYQALQTPYTFSSSPLDHLALRLGLCRPPTLAQQISAAWQSRLLLAVESYILQHNAQARSLTQQLLHEESGAQAHQGLSWVDRLFTRSVMQCRRMLCHLRYATHPSMKAAALLYVQAEEAYYLGDMETAVTLYRRVGKELPVQDTIQQRLGDIAYEQGDYVQALTALRCCIGQDTPLDDLDVWDVMVLGELCYHTGEYQQALTALTHALTRPAPLQDYKLPYYLGLCKLRAGARCEARAYFTQTVQLLNPDIASLRLSEAYRISQRQAGQPTPVRGNVVHR